jgi:hypothetical protein
MEQKMKSKAATCSEKEKKENLKMMVRNGEPLATALIGTLSLFGSSPEALMAEIYALAKAWATLKAVSLSKGINPIPLYMKLMPMFDEEAEEMMQEIEEEEYKEN